MAWQLGFPAPGPEMSRNDWHVDVSARARHFELKDVVKE
jgi:hypothetical protein